VPAPATTPAAPGPATLTGNVLGGRIELIGSGGNKVDARDLADTVVYFVPESAPKPQPRRHTMYTQGKAFDPALLVVTVGSTVAFPNSDPIRHNVYSATPGSAFDLGFYGEGEAREHVFTQPGLVVVNCNVHHVMQAQVLVLPTSHYTRADATGGYRLENLPATRGTLHVWHPRAQPSELSVALPTPAAVNRKIVLTKPRVGR